MKSQGRASKLRPSFTSALTSAFSSPIHFAIGSIIAASLALLTWPAAADDDPWRLRGNLTGNDLFDLTGDTDPIDSTLGFGLSIERRFTPLLGLEVGALHGEIDWFSSSVVLDQTIFDQEYQLDYTGLTAALNFHLTPGRAVDLYLGPLVALIEFDDFAFTESVFRDGRLRQQGSTFFQSSTEVAWGAQIGADFAFGDSPWSLNVSAKYLETTVEHHAFDSEVDFDPLLTGVGFSYRF